MSRLTDVVHELISAVFTTAEHRDSLHKAVDEHVDATEGVPAGTPDDDVSRETSGAPVSSPPITLPSHVGTDEAEGGDTGGSHA